MSSLATVSDWDYTGCAGLAGLKGEERCIRHIFQIASVKKANIMGKDWVILSPKVCQTKEPQELCEEFRY